MPVVLSVRNPWLPMVEIEERKDLKRRSRTPLKSFSSSLSVEERFLPWPFGMTRVCGMM
jgi:hypothetical protein